MLNTKGTPFSLPASHFAAGLFFFAAAAVLLPFAVIDLTAGRFLAGKVVALVHLYTLGWLTISIMGALCQLFPVVLDAPLRWPRLGYVTVAIFVPGLLLFVCGLLGHGTLLVVIGASLFILALLTFLINAIATLKRAQKRDVTWWALSFALCFLAATLTFGGALAGNLHWSFLSDRRLAVLTLHMHVAIAGWVGLVAMGVGHRLLPMFMLSHGANERWLKLGIALTASGCMLLTLLHSFMTRALFTVATSLLAAGAVLLFVQVGSYISHRHRPQLDAGMRLAVSGMALLLIAVLLGLYLLIAQPSFRLVVAYGIALVGSFVLFVAGHYYKILPFLVWNHRYAPHVGRKELPKIGELLDGRVTNFVRYALVLGVTGLIAATLTQHPTLAVPAAISFAAGALTEVIQLGKLLTKRPT